MHPRGTLIASGLAAPPLHLRHTAGCRPCVTPGTARHRLATVTPADRGPRERPSSRRSSLEPSKITLKGDAFGAVTRDALRAPLTVIFPGSVRRLPQRRLGMKAAPHQPWW